MKSIWLYQNSLSFKPCYKWNTFNTEMTLLQRVSGTVLNLVISGIPSILNNVNRCTSEDLCFKPCYKWNTFNTQEC